MKLYSSPTKDLLIVYLAGNPTPSFLAAYNRILESLGSVKVLHWGDIDVGGFRIAARVADSIRSIGQSIYLWRMNPLEVASGQQRAIPNKKIIDASTICEKYGWSEEAEGLRQNPIFQEQEYLDWVPPHD